MLNDNVKASLKELFQWAADCYKDWRKDSFGKENEYICFSVDEPEVQKHWTVLRDFFLSPDFDKSKLFFESLEGNGKQTPPPTDEEFLMRGVEFLLEWAGVSLSSLSNKQTVDQFIEEFENGIGVKPVEITFIPVFGLHTQNSFWREQQYRLCDNVEVGFLNRVDRELLATEAKRTGHLIGAPAGFVNILPQICLVIRKPLHVSHEAVRGKIDLAMRNFRIFCSGIWGADIEVPFQFTGIKSPFSPWQYTGGGHPRKFEDHKGYKSIGDFEWKLLEKYWPELHPKTLEKYVVTASRLSRSVTRGHWTDKVVDIAIALEGLFDGKHSLNFRYQTILPRIVGENFQKSKELYGTVKELMDLRNNIVHGDTLDSAKELEKFKQMNSGEMEKHIEGYRRVVRAFLTIQLLNKDLRSSQGQHDLLLGKEFTIIRSPTP